MKKKANDMYDASISISVMKCIRASNEHSARTVVSIVSLPTTLHDERCLAWKATLYRAFGLMYCQSQQIQSLSIATVQRSVQGKQSLHSRYFASSTLRSMGLRRVVLALEWPALFASCCHVLSVVGLVVLNKLVLDVVGFRFAITLTLVQYASIAISLWFWSIFGLFRLRRVPFYDAFRLAIGASICSMLSMLSLKHNSLAAYQSIRMTTAPVVLLVECLLGVKRVVRRRNAAVASFAIITGATIIAVHDSNRNDLGLLFAVCGVIVTALYQVLSLSLRLTTKANELQLQLWTKSIGCLCIIPFVPVFDNYAPSSAMSIFYFDFDEHAAFLIICTGLLAFLSFVAMRASINRNSASSYNMLVYLVSTLIFTAHFKMKPSEANRVQVVAAALVVSGTILFAYARDKYKTDAVVRSAADAVFDSASEMPHTHDGDAARTRGVRGRTEQDEERDARPRLTLTRANSTPLTSRGERDFAYRKYQQDTFRREHIADV